MFSHESRRFYVSIIQKNATDFFTAGGLYSDSFRGFPNRADGAIGSNWSGNTSAYSISSKQLDVVDGGSNTDIYWANESFGADQQVFVTFSQVDPDDWEQDLLLKSQSSATWGDGVLEVLYDTNIDISDDVRRSQPAHSSMEV